MPRYANLGEGQLPLGHPRRSSEARDAGLRLVRRANRWLIVGTIAGSGALALVARDAFHGRTVSTGAGGSSPASAQPAGAPGPAGSPSDGGGVSPSDGGGVSPSDGGAAAPQPPAQPPASAPAAPDASGSGAAVSGGS
jgi:hypothetical protein